MKPGTYRWKAGPELAGGDSQNLLFSHTSCMDLGMAESISPPFCSRLRYLNNFWIDCLYYYMDIHGPQIMNPTDVAG